MRERKEDERDWNNRGGRLQSKTARRGLKGLRIPPSPILPPSVSVLLPGAESHNERNNPLQSSATPDPCLCLQRRGTVIVLLLLKDAPRVAGPSLGA